MKNSIRKKSKSHTKIKEGISEEQVKNKWFNDVRIPVVQSRLQEHSAVLWN